MVHCFSVHVSAVQCFSPQPFGGGGGGGAAVAVFSGGGCVDCPCDKGFIGQRSFKLESQYQQIGKKHDLYLPSISLILKTSIKISL